MRVGPKPHGRLRMLIRIGSRTYSVQRPTSSADTNQWGEETRSYTSLQVKAKLFSPNELNIELEFGERLRGDLMGLALGEADVQSDDEYTVGADTYKVDDIEQYPPDGEAVYTMFSLTKLVNDGS